MSLVERLPDPPGIVPPEIQSPAYWQPTVERIAYTSRPGVDSYRTVCVEQLGATYGDGKGGAAPPMCEEIDAPYQRLTEAGGEAWAFPAPGTSAWLPAPLSGSSVRVREGRETGNVLPEGVVTVPGVVTHSGSTSTPVEILPPPPDVSAVPVPASGLLLAGVMCAAAIWRAAR